MSIDPIQFIKENKKELINKFVPDSPSMKEQLLICMAGSSGAGKTETAKSLIQKMNNNSIIRIDADDIKEWIAEKCNCSVNDCHGAASLGVEKVFDFCLKKKRDIIIDGTFVDKEKGINNVERALSSKRNYTIMIFYVYQDPKLAWEFIQKRSEKTGRKVPYKKFKETFLKSIQNVIAVKEKFKEEVVIHAVEKNFNLSEERYTMNISEKDLQSLQENVIMEHQSL